MSPRAAFFLCIVGVFANATTAIVGVHASPYIALLSAFMAGVAAACCVAFLIWLMPKTDSQITGAKEVRAILIDPERQTVNEIDIEVDGVGAIKTLIGADEVESFRIAEFEDGGFDYAWVDDTGLSRGEPVSAFKLKGRNDPVAGRCVILGVDKAGMTTDSQMPTMFLTTKIDWLGLIIPEVTWDETATGARSIVTYTRAK